MCRNKGINIKKKRSVFRHDFQTDKRTLVRKKYQQKSSRSQYFQQNINELQNQKETLPPSYGTVYLPRRQQYGN